MDIAKMRKEKKLTQIELARLVGVSVNTIVKWEQRVSTPSDENFVKLVRALEPVDKIPFGE